MKMKDGMEYLGFRTGIACLGLLPYGWAEGFLCSLAGAGAGLGVFRRDLVRAQLSETFANLDDDALESTTSAVYDHLGRMAAEVLFADPETLASSVRVDPGWGPLEAAMSAGRGVIAATGHIGNFELGGRILARRYPLLDVVKRQRNPLFDRYMDRLRHRHGIQTVSVDKSGRAVLSHLRQGGLVSLLVDQDAGRTGLRTSFLGRPASTWPGAARISLRTGCPVVPMAIHREDDGGHVLRLVPALEPTDFSRDDVRGYAKVISEAVEKFIIDRPAQWLWGHRRWKGAHEAG